MLPLLRVTEIIILWWVRDLELEKRKCRPFHYRAIWEGGLRLFIESVWIVRKREEASLFSKKLELVLLKLHSLKVGEKVKRKGESEEARVQEIASIMHGWTRVFLFIRTRSHVSIPCLLASGSVALHSPLRLNFKGRVVRASSAIIS